MDFTSQKEDLDRSLVVSTILFNRQKPWILDSVIFTTPKRLKSPNLWGRETSFHGNVSKVWTCVDIIFEIGLCDLKISEAKEHFSGPTETATLIWFFSSTGNSKSLEMKIFKMVTRFWSKTPGIFSEEGKNIRNLSLNEIC